jgi:hypothetical protein
MRLTRLRTGELLAAFGALVLLVALLLPWFELAGETASADVHETGLRSLGWLALVPLVLTLLGAFGLVVATVAERTPTLPLAIGVATVPLALVAVLVVAVRLIAEPGLGVGASDGEVAIRLPAIAGLVGALGVLAGTWLALADERTDTAEAIAQTERALSVRGAPRPVPPPSDRPS